MQGIAESEILEMAVKIQALQRGYTSPRNEKEIAKLVLSVEGLDLTRLKNAIDTGGDHSDLLELVYSDIDDKDIRAEILNHFVTRSAKFEKAPIRVLSDVDDTLYASLHDKRYPTSSLYPGVVTLHEELQAASFSEQSHVAALVLLTARPRDKMGVVERWTQRQMTRKGLPQVTVLSGTLFDLRSHEAMALRKFTNFQIYQELYPEYVFVFFGDSGQGDAILGRMMREQLPNRVVSILIHQVNDRLPEEGTRTFDTYFGASLSLLSLGLLDEAACARVYQSSLEHMEKIVFDSNQQMRAAKDALERELSRTSPFFLERVAALTAK